MPASCLQFNRHRPMAEAGRHSLLIIQPHVSVLVVTTARSLSNDTTFNALRSVANFVHRQLAEAEPRSPSPTVSQN